MPKVLRIINRLNLGGPTYNAAYLSAGLSPEFETLLLAGEKDDSEASSEFIVREMGLEPVYIHGMHREINLKNDAAAYRQIVKVIREFKPDIVHTHAAKAGTLGRLAAWREGVPVIVHTFHGHVFHSYFNRFKTRFFIGIERFLSRISTAIITISEEQKKDLTQVYRVCSTEQTEVIPLGFDLSRFSIDKDIKRTQFRSDYHISDDTLAVGIIGRLVPVKNHQLFLEAWKQVTDKADRPVKAFIIGDGESRAELERLCSELNLSYSAGNGEGYPQVVFTSWIENVDYALAGLDIIALSSFNEGTPVSLIEAQAAGKPIVSTEVGGISNAVLPGISALLSPSGDVKIFAGHLLQLIQNDEQRTNMSVAGTEFVMQRYDYRRLVSETGSLYHRLLRGKN